MTGLKNCPFCGGEPTRYEHSQRVYCPKPECAGWTCVASDEEWNTRQETSVTVEAITDAILNTKGHGLYHYPGLKYSESRKAMRENAERIAQAVLSLIGGEK